MGVYLAACAIYRDEAPYLAEWIEFHRLVGVERFFLYDNFGEDDHERVLRPYVRERLVTAHPWHLFGDQQRRAYEHCLAEHGEEARWIAFFDLDEFLFSPLLRPLPELLADYEQSPGVCVARREFTMSGHRTRPEGLVIESYRRALIPQADRATPFKSIVDPVRALECVNSHNFTYREGALPVDEAEVAMHPPWRGRAIPLERLRVNHYLTKSVEEARRKVETPWPNSIPRSVGLPPGFDDWERTEPQMTVEDDSIVAYGEAVREALDRRQSGSPALS